MNLGIKAPDVKEETLEQYMIQELKASPRTRKLSSLYKTTLEDFKLIINEQVPDEKIYDIIINYYQEKGYSIVKEKCAAFDYFVAQQGLTKLFINVTNFRNDVVVTVAKR